LSQRLSHARLSISDYTAKLQTAHYIGYTLPGRKSYLDNCRNSRANTCKSPGTGQPAKGVFTRIETTSGHSTSARSRVEGSDKTTTIQSKFDTDRGPRARDDSDEFPPYQLSTVV